MNAGVRAHGFTLVEVLLALALLALGVALAFPAVRSAQVLGMRNEAVAAGHERMRAVSALLHDRLVSALPVTQARDGEGRPLRFIGEPARMQFVAGLPAYLGEGGPRVHALELVGEAGARQLLLDLRPLPAPTRNGTVAGESAIAPEMLADGLAAVRFRYRGHDPDGRPQDWQPRWPWPERMPAQVEIMVEPESGPAWPAIVASLPRGEPGGGAWSR